MDAGYCMCVDSNLEDREITCSIRTYIRLREQFAGLDFRIHLDDDVEENTIIMSPELYGSLYHDMLEILSVDEEGLCADSPENDFGREFGFADSELAASDSCV